LINWYHILRVQCPEVLEEKAPEETNSKKEEE